MAHPNTLFAQTLSLIPCLKKAFWIRILNKIECETSTIFQGNSLQILPTFLSEYGQEVHGRGAVGRIRKNCVGTPYGKQGGFGMLRVGSLFSGAGLCDLGLSWAGMEHAFFCEIDPFCRSVLHRHWPQVPLFEDITKLSAKTLPPLDVLCGGFPCQDVSSGGKRAGIKQGTRSGLWSEYARLISEIRPKYAIIENVRGLLSCGIEIVLQDLADIGYDAEWEVLPAAALGAPHRRERVFIVAYPHGARVDAIGRVLSPLKGIVGKGNEHWSVPDWLGIRFDRARKASSREAYGGRVLCRVDDGRSTWLDVPDSVKRTAVETAKAWQPRLKALGNGICPQQAYALGMCIMKAEGLTVQDMQK